MSSRPPALQLLGLHTGAVAAPPSIESHAAANPESVASVALLLITSTISVCVPRIGPPSVIKSSDDTVCGKARSEERNELLVRDCRDPEVRVRRLHVATLEPGFVRWIHLGPTRGVCHEIREALFHDIEAGRAARARAGRGRESAGANVEVRRELSWGDAKIARDDTARRAALIK
jgi:hypothetical protein